MKRFMNLQMLSKAAFVLLPLMALVSCKSNSNDPTPNPNPKRVWKSANVELAMPSNALRAEFVGDHGLPSKIKWIDLTDPAALTIPFFVADKSGNGIQDAGTFTFKDNAYKGELSFMYDESIVDSNGKFEYIACDMFSIHPDSWVKDATGQPVVSNHGGHSAYIQFVAESNAYQYQLTRPNDNPLDATCKSVGWPLLSVNVDNPAKLFSIYDTKANKNFVKFMLFGDMLLLNLRNYTDEATFDFGNDPDHLPTLTIKSNGMAFNQTGFYLKEGNGGVREVAPQVLLEFFGTQPNTNEYSEKITNLKFTDFGEGVMIPIWFRPYDPAYLNTSSMAEAKTEGAKPFYITIELKYFKQKATGDWEEQVVRRTLNSTGQLNVKQSTKTLFDAHDGKFYTLNVDFGDNKGITFGANSFYNVEVTPPPFE